VDILFVTSYPPAFDASSRKAVDHVRALRAEGHRVEVLSPSPSAAHHHHPLRSWRSVAPVAALVRRYDRVVVAEDLSTGAPLRAALRAARSVDVWRAPDIASAPTVPHDVGWPAERDAAMAEIRARAAGSRAAAGELSTRVRRVPALTLPSPASARPGAATAKRVVRKLTAWQVDPIVARINQLRAALIETLESMEQRDER
jgi:hypothetical protein